MKRYLWLLLLTACGPTFDERVAECVGRYMPHARVFSDTLMVAMQCEQIATAQEARQAARMAGAMASANYGATSARIVR